MSKTAYNISLNDYVEGRDFNRITVDRQLDKMTANIR